MSSSTTGTGQEMQLGPPPARVRAGESARKRVSQNARLRAQLWKTEMCRYKLRRGKCRAGQACPFAHNERELQSRPDLKKTSLCRLWVTGACDVDECPFAHGSEELKVASALGSSSPHSSATGSHQIDSLARDSAQPQRCLALYKQSSRGSFNGLLCTSSDSSDEERSFSRAEQAHSFANSEENQSFGNPSFPFTAHASALAPQGMSAIDTDATIAQSATSAGGASPQLPAAALQSPWSATSSMSAPDVSHATLETRKTTMDMPCLYLFTSVVSLLAQAGGPRASVRDQIEYQRMLLEEMAFLLTKAISGDSHSMVEM